MNGYRATMTLYPEHRYDDHGQLRPPLWFWPIALLLTRSVWLFLMAGVTRESGSAILTLFYPDKLTLYISLLTDVPAMLALLACGGTHRQTHSARAWLRRHSPLLLLCRQWPADATAQPQSAAVVVQLAHRPGAHRQPLGALVSAKKPPVAGLRPGSAPLTGWFTGA